MGEGRVSLTPCADFYRPVEELEYTDFSKLKSPYSLFVDALGSKQVFQYVYHMRLWITLSIVTDNIVYVVSF